MSRFKPGTAAKWVPSRPAREPRRAPATSVVVAASAPISLSPAEPVGESVVDTGSKIALIFTLLFLFLRFSFLHEFVMAKIGFDSHLLLITGGAAVLSALLAGGFFRGFVHPISFCWLGFAACLCAATATSVWKGGSFAVLFPYLRTTLIIVALIPAVALSRMDISRVLRTIGLAGFVPIFFGIASNDYRSGRLELSGAGASIENSNDFAALLILVLPALAYLTLRPKTTAVSKILGIIGIGLACFMILGTGSRGALLSMIISTLYVLKAGSGKIRLGLLVGLPVIALAVIPFLPGEASQRLASLFNPSDRTEEAVESQEQRTQLLLASLRISLANPLTGVGPGTFQIYQAGEAEAAGQRGMWHETHNSYTQVSSECGIPAFLFYVTAIVMTFLTFQRGMKSSDPDLKGACQILSIMLISFSVCMFFLAQAYGFGFPVLGGFAISVDRILKRRALTQ